jgi:hypothetical protein
MYRKKERKSDRDCGVVFFRNYCRFTSQDTEEKNCQILQGLHGIHRHTPHVDTEVQTPLDIFLSGGQGYYSRIATYSYNYWLS